MTIIRDEEGLCLLFVHFFLAGQGILTFFHVGSFSIKYVFYEEVKDFIKSGKSVLVYNHRCRKPERKYFDDIEDRLQENVGIDKGEIQVITFPKGTIRDYFAIPACKKHYDLFHDAFAEMKEKTWGQHDVCR